MVSGDRSSGKQQPLPDEDPRFDSGTYHDRMSRPYFEKLRKAKENSLPLHMLVIQSDFRVRNVESEFVSAHDYFPSTRAEPGYSGLVIPLITMGVEPVDSSIPVKTLKFPGYSPVRIGDGIAAKIPKYRTRTVKRSPLHEPGARTTKDYVFYHNRKFRPVENAIELAIKDGAQGIARVDRSVNYDVFRRR